VVHDWLVVDSGAEKVLSQILKIVPKADLYCLFDLLPKSEREFLGNREIHTSYLQKLPFLKKYYRNTLPLWPLLIDQFNLTEYDLIISSSFAVAKGVITGPDQIHISYVHTPPRYVWDLRYNYLISGGYLIKLRRRIIKYFFHRFRLWDVLHSNRVDYYIANSKFVAKRIWKFYRRKAKVIYPPVDTNSFKLKTKKGDYYLVISRLVEYKKVNKIVEAFRRIPDKKLIVIGRGPQSKSIKKNLPSNVKILDFIEKKDLIGYMQNAKAFIHIAQEDFGIVMGEAISCGTPVIAFSQGGALEIIQEGKSGIFIKKQTIDEILLAVEKIEKQSELIDPKICHEYATKFREENFQRNFKEYLVKILTHLH